MDATSTSPSRFTDRTCLAIPATVYKDIRFSLSDQLDMHGADLFVNDAQWLFAREGDDSK
jgi:hypothetical protein